jgi:hypothetical protein
MNKKIAELKGQVGDADENDDTSEGEEEKDEIEDVKIE